MEECEKHTLALGTRIACNAFGLPRATIYRRRKRLNALPVILPQNPHPRALDDIERQAVLEVLHSERFVDQPPSQVFAALLDEQTYLCSIRTMYRILAENHEIRERRNLRGT